jgi:hypothetical protein
MVAKSKDTLAGKKRSRAEFRQIEHFQPKRKEPKSWPTKLPQWKPCVAPCTKMSPEFQAALPPQINVEKFIRTTLTAVQMQPELLQADRRACLGLA